MWSARLPQLQRLLLLSTGSRRTVWVGVSQVVRGSDTDRLAVGGSGGWIELARHAQDNRTEQVVVLRAEQRRRLVDRLDVPCSSLRGGGVRVHLKAAVTARIR